MDGPTDQKSSTLPNFDRLINTATHDVGCCWMEVWKRKQKQWETLPRIECKHANTYTSAKMFVCIQCFGEPFVDNIPNTNCFVIGSTDQKLSGRMPANITNPTVVANESVQTKARACIPKFQRLIPRPGHKVRALQFMFLLFKKKEKANKSCFNQNCMHLHLQKHPLSTWWLTAEPRICTQQYDRVHGTWTWCLNRHHQHSDLRWSNSKQ